MIPAAARARWPRTAVLGSLAALAVCLGVQELLRPEWTAAVGPAVLAVATGAIGLLAAWHGRRLDARARATWRGFAVISGLLALGQAARAVTGVGLNPSAAGWSDVVLAASGPVAVLVCVRLVRSTGGRVRRQPLLDATVALVALGALVQVLIPVATGSAGIVREPLLTLGYPVVSAVLCAVGLVTFAGVSAPRRRAAGWLMLCFAGLAVVVASGALAVATPSPLLDVVTSTAYLGLLAAATLALAADPGPRGSSDDVVVEVPLAGVVVSYCVAFGVVLVLVGAWAAGRPLVTLEAATVALLVLLIFVRTLVWAAHAARLTRRLVRTEEYLRALVSSAEDVTVVLDAAGTVTWASGR